MTAMPIRIVPPEDSDALLEKQLQARRWLLQCPYRKLLNTAWKRYFAHLENDNVAFPNEA